ncbi:hypothetical protein CBM2633_P350018 [Cupriavidus taiwanensis]|nr:hypothetical protein CBM2597_P300014 [Cupriavidus taiwanensis]SOZ93387.1 hypothetical protein CBM2622_P370017 [Cupriavidus taiwanensis]SOZ95744.1 hypothetical protein CBM2598_P280011 [Cupriavidus taiwanensis]SOZ96774.1 hypothetical protein CBM2621_P360018 [Cupriavidus taiwanensis]SPA23427.1 hypothetical protein CBM2633_P350018 [Cupriavidus taiwanensis]
MLAAMVLAEMRRRSGAAMRLGDTGACLTGTCRGNPGQRRLGEQATGDDTRQRRRDLDAQIAARAGTLDALVLDDTDLFREHVQLFADLNADLDQRVAIVGTEVFGLRQVVTHHFAWQLGTRDLRPRLLRV